MQCPFCPNLETKVVDSRLSSEGDNIRRRRECEKCGGRFTTYERYEDVMPMVIKKDGRRVAFDRTKILGGIQRASEKRPVTMEQMERVVSEIENALRSEDIKEIPVTLIGERVMEKLKSLDHVAYVRFASVYRSFKDVNGFLEEVRNLMQKG